MTKRLRLQAAAPHRERRRRRARPRPSRRASCRRRTIRPRPRRSAPSSPRASAPASSTSCRYGVVARLTAAARRARARCHRAVLQGAARRHGHLRDRQSHPDDRGGEHLRARLQAGEGRLPLRCLGLLHQVHDFIFKRFTGAKCDERLCLLRHRHRARPDRLLAAGRHLLRRSSCWPSTTSRRIWRGVWGIDGQYDFVHAVFDDGTQRPEDAAASRWAAASTIATRTGSRA